MSIDLSQFHQVFFEESFEGLDAMENSLMELDPSAIDSEVINTIFRSAHSIKGGSATFGFDVVAEFTHVLETLLDEIRDGKRGITQDQVDLFLQSVDCMRDLLEALQAEETPETVVSEKLKKEFEAILAGGNATAPAGDAGSAESSVESNADEAANAQEDDVSTSTAETQWNIYFKPCADVLRTGNDPLRMLRDLSELGEMSVDVDASNVPDFGAMDPESCYLAWNISLRGNVTRQQIDEVFEWVVDESELTIETGVSAQASSGASGWQIYFKPGPDTLRTGNEPLRMFRELAELGDLKVSVVNDDLPDFVTMDPEVCYLAWNLTLTGDAERTAVDEVFEWVVDEAVLNIDAIASAPASQKAATSNKVAAKESVEEGVVKESVVKESVVEESAPEAQAAAAPATTPDVAPVKKAPAKKASTEASSIRVGIDKVDDLINMVGELVITQSMLGQLGDNFDMKQLPSLIAGLAQLEHNTRELQESVMRIRMLPISFAFSRFPRMVRDLSRRLDKKMDLVMTGEQTEMDKTVMEKIGDPLVHLVRNSVDHGIETPAERIAAGKDETGKVTLNAFHQGGNVVIEIIDDGKGLDRDKLLQKGIEKGLVNERDAQALSDSNVYDLIFQPGFSTAAQVSDVSGRGVGMDVVRRNIQELNGSVEIKSKLGEGSTITIRLPLTLAILDGQLVRVGTDIYIFPLVSIIESLQITREQLSRVAGGCEVFQLRNEYVPIIRLFDAFGIEPDSRKIENSLLVVVESDGEKVGVVVDELAAQQQVVIKSLENNYQRVEGVSGATILGDGTVALILDVAGIVKIAGVRHQDSSPVTSLSEGFRSNSLTAAH